MTTTSAEIIEGLLSRQFCVYKNGAFRDDPGNSVVYAAPAVPGLDLDSLLELEEAYVRVSSRIITGKKDILAEEYGFHIVVDGSGIISRKEKQYSIEEGDIFIYSDNVSLQSNNIGLTIASLEICTKRPSVANNLVADKYLHASSAKFCSALPEAVFLQTSPGCLYYASPWFSTQRFRESSGQKLRLGLSTVSIRGAIPEGEPLHHHISSIIAIIYDGEGILMEPHNLRTRGKAGDGIVVPVDAPHYFESSREMSYCALEFGNNGTDYQKHYHD